MNKYLKILTELLRNTFRLPKQFRNYGAVIQKIRNIWELLCLVDNINVRSLAARAFDIFIRGMALIAGS